MALIFEIKEISDDQIIKGDKGDQGLKGDKGDQGLKGDKGDQGLKGDKGDQGLNGDKGDQGLKGDKGDQGLNGVDGFPNFNLPAMIVGSTVATLSDESTVSAITGTLVKWDSPLYQILNGSIEVAGTAYPDNNLGTAKYITSTYASPQFTVEFILNGDVFEVYYKQKKGIFRVFVNDVLVCENLTQLNNGGLYYRKITLTGGKAMRKIRIETAIQFYFGGIKIKTGDSIEAPIVRPQKRALFFTDSFGEPANVNNGWNSFCHVAGRILGVNSIASGSGGTGFTTAGSTVGRLKFIDRIADITRFNPDIVLICGGINDAQATTAVFQSEVDNFFTALKSLLPSCEIVIVSNWRPRDSETPSWDTMSLILERKAVAIGAKFINTKGWFTGNGNIATPNLSGNTDLFIQSDGTHPTEAGQIYLGNMVAKAYMAMKFII